MRFTDGILLLVTIALENDLDGELLWLMVDDFNEFSVVVTNPVERLHIKKFVKTYNSSQATGSSETRSDDVVEASLNQLTVSFTYESRQQSMCVRVY